MRTKPGHCDNCLFVTSNFPGLRIYFCPSTDLFYSIIEPRQFEFQDINELCWSLAYIKRTATISPTSSKCLEFYEAYHSSKSFKRSMTIQIKAKAL